MTRQEYLNANSTVADTFALHREYQAQFVTPELIAAVVSRIGREALRDSTDPHLNDIPLGRWDQLAPSVRFLIEKPLRDAGDCYSLSMAVCTTKEAARQWIESETVEA